MLNQLKKINFQKYLSTALVLSSLFNVTLAQEQQFLVSINANPIDSDYWWLNKNNFGIKKNNFDFEASWNLKKNKTVYRMDISLNSGDRFYINESFIKYNFSNQTFLRIGKYYRDFSKYLNDEISSGSMLISHNAESMPKIGIITSRDIKKSSDIDFQFGIAHGIFEKNEFYDSAPFLHEKFIYMNVKKPNYELSVGFVHEAIWGGSTFLLGNQPDQIKDFLKVFISADGPLKEGESHANALGNHLGIWDFYYQKNIDDYIIKLYYQHFFEDTSGLRFANKWDGLWGIELINYIPNTNILFEYIDTTNQYINPPYVADAYYNHTIYNSGWSYKDYTIGNPFLSHNGINPSKVVHLGINGPVYHNYFYGIKASRRINTSDFIKYQLDIKKEISLNHILNFFVFNSNKEIGIGLSFSKIF